VYKRNGRDGEQFYEEQQNTSGKRIGGGGCWVGLDRWRWVGLDRYGLV